MSMASVATGRAALLRLPAAAGTERLVARLPVALARRPRAVPADPPSLAAAGPPPPADPPPPPAPGPPPPAPGPPPPGGLSGFGGEAAGPLVVVAGGADGTRGGAEAMGKR